jgi:glycosyltransferase involved in cell wall biosynthesis
MPSGLWLVIAAFNEGERIGPVLQDVLRIARNVVVVDDGSTDGTGDAVLRTRAWLVTHPVNLGQGAALQTGISFALQRGATHIVTFDADGQHSAEAISALVGALSASGADYALGSRFLGRAEGIPWARRVMLSLAVSFTRLLSGASLSDTHNGLRAMTRRGAERLRITFNRMEHASELIDQIVQSGLRYVEVPVNIRYTAATTIKGQRTSAAIGMGLRLLLNKVTR